MTLLQKIQEWKKNPYALGSESQAELIVREIAAALQEEIPEDIKNALVMFGLRRVLFDAELDLQREFNMEVRHEATLAHDIFYANPATNDNPPADVAPWAPALTSIADYIDKQLPRLG